MADEREVVVSEINRLFEFLDDLQASGYRIDPRQVAALNHLLVTLIARGEALDQLPLKMMIAPLVCSTALEQEDLYQRFERWRATLLPVKQIDSEGELPFIPPPQEVDIPPAIEPAIQQETPYITREATKQETNYTTVLVKGYVQEILPVTQIKPIVSALRKRTQVPSTEVDVDRTIEYAISHNNWMEVVYRQRQALPEYVVLIDRKNRLDLQARFVQEVLAKLAADGVWLHQYEFKGDPRICFPLDKKNTPLRLKDLQARHPDARLLLFSGTNELTNPLTGNLQEWLENLEYWKERAILTPDNLGMVLQEGLEDQDFAILPLTFDGLASIVRVFESENILLSFGGPNLPAPLTERPTRWTGRSTPPETEVKSLIHELKNKYFDKNESGFYWLCATAVYPELRWELTLHLGSVLKDNGGKPLLDAKTLILLSRLPWFRLGYMPDWIRLSLIESFLPEQELQVRDVLSNLFSATQDGLVFELAIAREANALLPKQILQDHVMIKFLASSEKKKIDITVPSSLQNIFSQNQSNTDQLDHSKSILDSSPESSITNDKRGTLNEKAHNDLINSTPNQIGYKHSSNLKPRVLIVDNDPTARISYQSLLMDWGYDPVLAMGTGKTLIDNAKKLAQEKRCALALIDLRLINNDDEQDTSGLILAEAIIGPLRPVIMSDYYGIDLLRRNILKDIAFIRKEEGRDLFQKILNDEAAKVTAAKRGLLIENTELLDDAASSLRQFTDEYTDQITDVLARLFPKAQKLRLEKLTLYSSQSMTSTAPRSASVILKVYEDDFEPCIVKISRAARIQREIDNYQKHILKRLTTNFFSRMERTSVLWDIGAIAYSYIGGFDTKTFSKFYEEEPIADIEKCLSSFFQRTWGGNYKQAHNVNDISLFDLYSSVWGNWIERIKRVSDPDSAYLDVLYEQMNLPRPIEWIKNNIAEASIDASIIGKTRIAITHGDLHSDNLLVDSKNNPWVISYERCGEGHILQDFIELEADIINRLDVGDEDLSNYIKMLITVLEQKRIRGFDKSKTSSENGQFEKALQTISILRSLALTSTEVTDAREYLLGLLFNVIFRVSMQGVNSLKSQPALLFASLICHRLDHWDKPWSLSSAKKYQDHNLNLVKEDNNIIEKNSGDENTPNAKQQFSKTTSPAHPLGKERFLRVFIAHTSENKSDAKYLYDYLHKLDVAPWLDSEKIKGQNWNKEILKARDETDIILLCLSKKSVKRGNLTSTLQSTLEYVLKDPEESNTIIPVRLDKCEIPKFLKDYQIVDLFADNGIEKLLVSLNARAQQIAVKTISLEGLPEFDLRMRKRDPLQFNVQEENEYTTTKTSKFALIIANADYKDARIARLSTPVNDAQGFAQVLREPNLAGFDEVKVLVNQNGDTTRRAIARLYSERKPDDLVLLYYSGHGIQSVEGKLFLAALDTEIDILDATSISADFISDVMSNCRSKRQLLILDCSYSGAIVRGAMSSNQGVASAAFQSSGVGRIVITSSSAVQFAWEGDKIIGDTKNSLFTHFLIEGLRGKADINHDGKISIDELYDYVYQQVVTRTPQQTPSKWSYNQQGDIFLRENLPVIYR